MQSIILPPQSGYPELNTPNEDQQRSVRKMKKISEEDRKMFNPSLDPYDVPLQWWESEHVKYAISYIPVRFRLLSLMKSDIVRLTDRKYMVRLASRIQQDREKKQMIRIEERKLPQPTVITKLLEISNKMFQERLIRSQSRKNNGMIHED